MNKRIQAILIGSILGDGHATPLSEKLTSRMDIKGDDKYLSYLEWLHAELSPLGVSKLKPKKNYHQHRFYTKATKEVGQLRKLFYPQGYKIIPKNIKQLLIDPLTLAIWYMDDGTLDCRSKYHYNALFATHCFSYDDCAALAKTLKDNFNLEVSICRCLMRGKLRFRLYVTASSMKEFIGLVKPYINSCFDYKIRT